MDVSLALLPGTRVPILACGGDDSRVHLYVQESGLLQKAMSLQGHEDWVRGVKWAFTGSELLLASCSQDSLIRVWRLCAKSATNTSAEDDHTVIKMKEDVFEVKDRGMVLVFAVSLETVLAGHENWVYGVNWQPPVYKGGELQQPLTLLSASMDKTMIIWAPEEGSGVWVEQDPAIDPAFLSIASLPLIHLSCFLTLLIFSVPTLSDIEVSRITLTDSDEEEPRLVHYRVMAVLDVSLCHPPSPFFLQHISQYMENRADSHRLVF
ncbi:Elongator subunit elp2 [Xenotaenia resolanae]|uniref:Elongator complex protein 2 n=1 Tax=Xenotaenia resolanae TaxID=208358 RepID=A0ABV0WIA8_9TELE